MISGLRLLVESTIIVQGISAKLLILPALLVLLHIPIGINE